jgi:hypothetical protein
MGRTNTWFGYAPIPGYSGYVRAGAIIIDVFNLDEEGDQYIGRASRVIGKNQHVIFSSESKERMVSLADVAEGFIINMAFLEAYPDLRPESLESVSEEHRDGFFLMHSHYRGKGFVGPRGRPALVVRKDYCNFRFGDEDSKGYRGIGTVLERLTDIASFVEFHAKSYLFRSAKDEFYLSLGSEIDRELTDSHKYPVMRRVFTKIESIDNLRISI